MNSDLQKMWISGTDCTLERVRLHLILVPVRAHVNWRVSEQDGAWTIINQRMLGLSRKRDMRCFGCDAYKF